MKRKAFTLIELLVVLAIIGVIVGLLLPSVQKVRETASRVECSNNLRQIGIATTSTYVSYNELPPANGPCPRNSASAIAQPAMVWLLPYMDQQNLYNGVPGLQPNRINTQVKSFVCPSDETIRVGVSQMNGIISQESFASYGGNALVFGTCQNTGGGFTFQNIGGTRYSDIPDGASNTILWIEKLGYCKGGVLGTGGNLWSNNIQSSPVTVTPLYMPLLGASPTDLVYPPNPSHATSLHLMGAIALDVGIDSRQCSWVSPSSGHTSVMTVGLVDGSTHTINGGLSNVTFNYAMIPNDGQMLGPDW